MQLQDGPIHLQLCQALLCPLCVFVDCYDVARGSIEESCNNGSALAVKAAAHRKMSRASRNQSASFGIVGGSVRLSVNLPGDQPVGSDRPKGLYIIMAARTKYRESGWADDEVWLQEGAEEVAIIYHGDNASVC